MEPALDVMNRALQGDPGARSFLERTTSIYILDVTDSTNPKTYGCWNFIHEAMNEVERFEAAQQQTNRVGGPAGKAALLIGHVRLLATMALRVARRSPAKDKSLVATCLSNAAGTGATAKKAQWLVEFNLELREIVMGRIAAMAFDFSFHNLTKPVSAFADNVVMDSFCAVLSANAIASGSVQHVATEWIIPSSRQLPALAVASVVLHLAKEGIRKTAPAGTKNKLQQLSDSVTVIVIMPTLAEALTDETDGEDPTTATVCLRAMKAWCQITDLSLPQMNHICQKSKLNFVGVLSDAMYSGSADVVDALAELLEFTVPLSDEKVMSVGRMNQVRYLLQVDEVTFRTRFSPEQLKTIEAKEMSVIVNELVSAIGLQRFRFVERQNRGEHAVCRNLARIGAVVCATSLETSEGQNAELESGPLNMLLKASLHPSVNICALALPVLSRYVSIHPQFAVELLPVLQRRVIIPHAFRDGTVFFTVPDACGVGFSEFRTFRETVLRSALVACFVVSPENFMDSCLSAVQEFCAEVATIEMSLQLEAVLFCVDIMAMNSDAKTIGRFDKILNALRSKPFSLMTNPLTRARTATLLADYLPWCESQEKVAQASELCLSIFMAFSSTPDPIVLTGELLEVDPSPAFEAAKALQSFLKRFPFKFVTETSLGALQAAWDSCDSSTLPRRIPLNARTAFGSGVLSVTQAAPKMHRQTLFEQMISRCLRRIEDVEGRVASCPGDITADNGVLSLFNEDVTLLTGLLNSFVPQVDEDAMDSSGDELEIPLYVYSALRKVWPTVTFVAAKFSSENGVQKSLSSVFTHSVPLVPMDSSLGLLKDLRHLALSLLEREAPASEQVQLVFHFLTTLVKTCGNLIEEAAATAISGNQASETGKEIGKVAENLIMLTMSSARNVLGNLWTTASRQFPLPHVQETVKRVNSSQDALAGALDLMKACIQHCPTFLLHFPAEEGVSGTDNRLFRRAVDTSLACLQGEDTEATRAAVRLLLAVSEHLNSLDRHVQVFVTESMDRIQQPLLTRLLAGVCGRYDLSMMDDAANLMAANLTLLPRKETSTRLLVSLSQDFFLLGDVARETTVAFCCRYAEQKMPFNQLRVFLGELWVSHQAEDSEALPCSDSVAWFNNRFKAPSESQ